MEDPAQELSRISREASALAERFEAEDLQEVYDALIQAVATAGKAASGSWLGYHACVYYDELQPPPPGASFDIVGGLGGWPTETRGDWVEYDPQAVKDFIVGSASKAEYERLSSRAQEASKEADELKEELLSVLLPLGRESDKYLQGLIEKIEESKANSVSDCVKTLRESSMPESFNTADHRAAGGGIQVPPHMSVLSQCIWAKLPFERGKNLSAQATRAVKHLMRQGAESGMSKTRKPTRVFIGHGRSHVWKDLREFVRDRLGLPCEFFERVPTAGRSNSDRINEMLDSSVIAFLVLTGEDETTEGSKQARLNVVHELGLFQGRLGFERAIVLLEEGCSEFSNIAGLQQIRFPEGDIEAASERIREVLEREGVLP